MRKRKNALTYLQKLKLMKESTLEDALPLGHEVDKLDGIPTLEERLAKILGIIEKSDKNRGNMLFFVMYDIESNKVRYNVTKYLQRKGCTRVQKSIFLANLTSEIYQSIRDDLTEIQSLYDNHDSIIICPVSTDHLKNMKIIGQNIDIDIIMKNKNTLFF